MARKYDYTFGPGTTAYGWGMERCEEHLLWAYFSEIEARIPPDQVPRKEEFFDKFFNHGLGVTFDTMAWINSIRRRAGLQPLEFKETTIYEYGKMIDRTQKAELRRQMRSEFFVLDAVGRARWRREAEEETARLLPPHHTHAEIRARRSQFNAPSLTPRERAMRLHVVDQAVQAEQQQDQEEPVMQQSAAVTRALRQIKLAKKPETLAKIVALLTPDDALDVAECGEIEDSDLVDALVSRSLGLEG